MALVVHLQQRLRQPPGALATGSRILKGTFLLWATESQLLSQFSSVQSLSRVRLFATPGAAARQASLSITIFRSLLKLTSIESAMPSNHLILCCPFSSCLQSFPASGSFLMSQLFASGGQTTISMLGLKYSVNRDVNGCALLFHSQSTGRGDSPCFLRALGFSG